MVIQISVIIKITILCLFVCFFVKNNYISSLNGKFDPVLEMKRAASRGLRVGFGEAALQMRFDAERLLNPCTAATLGIADSCTSCKQASCESDEQGFSSFMVVVVAILASASTSVGLQVGFVHHKLPLPEKSRIASKFLSTLVKQGLADKLCRIEFFQEPDGTLRQYGKH